MADEIVLAGAVRTAIGTLGGVFADVHPARLGAIAIAEALRRSGIQAEQVDEVLFGNVIQGAQGMNVARQAAMQAGIPAASTATTINQACPRGCGPSRWRLSKYALVTLASSWQAAPKACPLFPMPCARRASGTAWERGTG